MKEVAELEAKDKFGSRLDQVEHGEEQSRVPIRWPGFMGTRCPRA